MIHTDTYYLKLLSSADSESFFTLIDNNRSRLEDFFAGTVEKTETLKATTLYCLEIEEKIKSKTYFPHLILELKTNIPVGFIDVKNIEWNISKGELGAFIDTHFEGKGIITHFVNSIILQIVKEYQFKKLLCRVASRNKRSIRVVENLGFILEKTVEQDYKTTKGELVDLNYYVRYFDKS